MRKWQKVIRSIAAVLVILCIAAGIGFWFYVRDYYCYQIRGTAVTDLAAEKEELLLEGIVLSETADCFEVCPETPAAGLIFYPGGKVEAAAYLPLMEQLAEEGICCLLAKMPCNLAVFDIDAAQGLRETGEEQYPGLDWYLGGHSLGGVMAASYLEEHTEEFQGLILLASYSTADLTDSDLRVLCINGSEDQVLNRDSYQENLVNLPEDMVEAVIEGGCHGGFGSYGTQEGDGEPAISGEEQIQVTARTILQWMREE